MLLEIRWWDWPCLLDLDNGFGGSLGCLGEVKIVSFSDFFGSCKDYSTSTNSVELGKDWTSGFLILCYVRQTVSDGV